MGSRVSPADDDGEPFDEWAHSVSVGDFYLAKTEVTLGEFRHFVQATQYLTTAESTGAGCKVFADREWKHVKTITWRNLGFPQDDEHPVACVSQLDALAYARWLSSVSNKRYGLPTEAQWEYAARAGTQSIYHWGDNPDLGCNFENLNDQASKRYFVDVTAANCNDGVIFTAPVGRYNPNGYGLYDMMGNVKEWTCSEYDSSYNGAEQRCAASGSHADLTVRGSSWRGIPPWDMRSASRSLNTRMNRNVDVGFRLTRAAASSISNQRTAIVFAPPSNIRKKPNGEIICSVRKKKSINILGEKNGWFRTDACEKEGFIHKSQIEF